MTWLRVIGRALIGIFLLISGIFVIVIVAMAVYTSYTDANKVSKQIESLYTPPEGIIICPKEFGFADANCEVQLCKKEGKTLECLLVVKRIGISI